MSDVGHYATLRTNEEACPLCGANLQGGPIPADAQPAFGATHFSRKIGVYSLERDRTVAWNCPDCGGEWSRLSSSGGRL